MNTTTETTMAATTMILTHENGSKIEQSIDKADRKRSMRLAAESGYRVATIAGKDYRIDDDGTLRGGPHAKDCACKRCERRRDEQAHSEFLYRRGRLS